MSKIWVIITLLLVVVASPGMADSKHKKRAASAGWDPYACCHNMTDTPGMPAVLVVPHLLPEFFFYDTVYNGDTALVCQCFDGQGEAIDADTLNDFRTVEQLSLVKNYTHGTHTYKADNGVELPLPVSVVACRYNRLGGGSKWMRMMYPGSKVTMLQEDTARIVRTDTLYNADPAHRLLTLHVVRYYGVADKSK